MGVGSSSEGKLPRSNTQLPSETNSIGSGVVTVEKKRRRRATLPFNLVFSNGRLSRRVETPVTKFAGISSTESSYHSSTASTVTETPSLDDVKETRAVKMGVDDDGNKTVNEYTIIRTLGKGSFGKVKLCMDLQNRPYAIKIMNKSILKRVQKVDEVRREVAILKKLSHPNVVKMYEVIDDPVNDNLFIVMEYVQNGAVMKLENGRTQKTFSESKSRKYMHDILNGLEYLHSMRVCHRDIKPENLLLDSEDNVKLTDFGVSHMFEGEDDTLKVTAGTPAFLSPEACAGENFSGKLADIWAVGITLFIFVFGYPPFFGDSYIDISKSIREDALEFPACADNYSPELIDLIKRLLDKDPQTRIRLSDVKKHPWITLTGTIEEAHQMEQQNPIQDSDEDSDPIPLSDTEVQNAIVERKVVDQLVLLVKMKAKLKKMASDARTRAPSDSSAMQKLANTPRDSHEGTVVTTHTITTTTYQAPMKDFTEPSVDNNH